MDQQKNDKIIRQLWPLVILAIIMAFKLITLPIASKMSGLAARCQWGQVSQFWRQQMISAVPVGLLSLSVSSVLLAAGRKATGRRTCTEACNRNRIRRHQAGGGLGWLVTTVGLAGCQNNKSNYNPSTTALRHHQHC